MSSANSPAHRVPGSFDGTSYYDHDFSVDISNRMRVPDKISVLPDREGYSNEDNRAVNANSHDWMRVPDRILVAGGDKYTAGRSTLPEQKLESSMLGEDYMQEQVQLMTPPRHLTLNEHKYPSIEQENDLNSQENNKGMSSIKELNFSPENEYGNLENGTPQQDAYLNSFYNPNSSISGNDEAALIRRQVKSLSRRITSLERENQTRFQRDVVIYTLGIVYFIMKGVSWMNRRW